jgi:negative regulator of sigma E activity
MQLSAFVDGELPENEAELLLRRLSQDRELRQQVAEFMAIGRAMRGEVQAGGIDRLRERVAEAIDAAPVVLHDADEESTEQGFVRPLAGFAIAATVALVAIFGLRQMSVDEQLPAVANEAPATYTQQQPGDIRNDEMLREMRRMHDETSADQSIDTRLTTLQVSDDYIEVDGSEHEDESVAPGEIATDDAAQ